MALHRLPQPANTKPGFSNVYLAPLADVTLPFPAVVGGATLGGNATISTNIAFAVAGNGFVKMPVFAYKGSKLMGETKGDVGTTSSEFKATWSVQGMDPIILDWLDRYTNVPMIALIENPDCNAPERYLIACDCNPGYLKYNFDSGELGGSTAKKFDFTLDTRCLPKKYTGVLTISALI